MPKGLRCMKRGPDKTLLALKLTLRVYTFLTASGNTSATLLFAQSITVQAMFMSPFFCKDSKLACSVHLEVAKIDYYFTTRRWPQFL